jgi:hypothetical protein
VPARLAACLAAAALALALAGGGVAGAQTCAAPAYPGDAAPREAIALWMAHGAGAAGLPRELPVMAALVESGLRNVRGFDNDSAGYFQMRVSIWNTGSYAGFPERPELQLQWFVDQATSVRRARIAAGAPDPAASESGWGEWIADVQRPAEARRGEYALRLAEARALVGPTCVPAAGSGGAVAAPGPVPGVPGVAAPAPGAAAADTVAPEVRLSADRRQRALRRGAIVATVACPAERCSATATAIARLPGARRALRLGAATGVVAAGGRATLRIALTRSSRARVRRALRQRFSLPAVVRVVARDAAGNGSVRMRAVRITR